MELFSQVPFSSGEDRFEWEVTHAVCNETVERLIMPVGYLTCSPLGPTPNEAAVVPVSVPNLKSE